MIDRQYYFTYTEQTAHSFGMISYYNGKDVVVLDSVGWYPQVFSRRTKSLCKVFSSEYVSVPGFIANESKSLYGKQDVYVKTYPITKDQALSVLNSFNKKDLAGVGRLAPTTFNTNFKRASYNCKGFVIRILRSLNIQDPQIEKDIYPSKNLLEIARGEYTPNPALKPANFIAFENNLNFNKFERILFLENEDSLINVIKNKFFNGKNLILTPNKKLFFLNNDQIKSVQLSDKQYDIIKCYTSLSFLTIDCKRLLNQLIDHHFTWEVKSMDDLNICRKLENPSLLFFRKSYYDIMRDAFLKTNNHVFGILALLKDYVSKGKYFFHIFRHERTPIREVIDLIESNVNQYKCIQDVINLIDERIPSRNMQGSLQRRLDFAKRFEKIKDPSPKKNISIHEHTFRS